MTSNFRDLAVSDFKILKHIGSPAIFSGFMASEKKISISVYVKSRTPAVRLLLTPRHNYINLGSDPLEDATHTHKSKL